MSGLRFTNRRLSARRLAMLILGGVMVLMVAGCYRATLHEHTGKNYQNIFNKQTRATYGRGQRHRGMGAEMANIAMQNVYADGKKSASGGGGGPQLIQLQR